MPKRKIVGTLAEFFKNTFLKKLPARQGHPNVSGLIQIRRTRWRLSSKTRRKAHNEVMTISHLKGTALKTALKTAEQGERLNQSRKIGLTRKEGGKLNQSQKIGLTRIEICQNSH